MALKDEQEFQVAWANKWAASPDQPWASRWQLVRKTHTDFDKYTNNLCREKWKQKPGYLCRVGNQWNIYMEEVAVGTGTSYLDDVLQANLWIVETHIPSDKNKWHFDGRGNWRTI